MIRKAVAIAGLLAFAFIVISATYNLPAFGSLQGRDVATYYTKNTLLYTGSANAVNSIVWDFRGYDTLGEETVLFTAALGVFLVLKGANNGRDNTDEL
jgi:multisubunit Na+/H+ antiporter MnhB subunit